MFGSFSRSLRARRPVCFRQNQPSATTRARQAPRRTLVAAPEPNSGPLMSRRADRELPNVAPSSRRWLTTLPIFAACIAISAAAIFNYQKTSSSVVNSTLYALRINSQARKELGDEIYFRDRFPWIWGEINQVKGKVDIGFAVKGKLKSGYVKFKSIRQGKLGSFETKEWTLETEDGKTIRLLDENDPFKESLRKASY